MTRLRPSLSPVDHLRGPFHASITLVEFGDFECPYCGEAYPEVEAALRTLGDRVCFAFRNFPIAAAHPHALLAAEAAEAAAAQGRFWEMHALLYRNQEALARRDLEGYAAQLGLDARQFDEDLSMHRHDAKVRADLHSGAVSGVNGTPTFFVNGYRHDGGYDYDSLIAAVAGASHATLSSSR